MKADQQHKNIGFESGREARAGLTTGGRALEPTQKYRTDSQGLNSDTHYMHTRHSYTQNNYFLKKKN